MEWRLIESILSTDPKLIAAAGGVGSAILAACGYIAKIRYERKRTLRSTLFYLLQLHQCAVTDELLATELPERVLSAFNEVITDRRWKLSDDDMKPILNVARPILAAVAERQSNAQLQEIRALLVKSLADLAKDQPILAYRLSAALPNVKVPGDDTGVRASDFLAETHGIVEEISRSIRAGLHAENARQSKNSLSRLIKMASFEIGIFAFLGANFIIRRQNKIKVPDEFFVAITRPMAVSIQSMLLAIESGAMPEDLTGISEAQQGPPVHGPALAGKLPVAGQLGTERPI